MLSQDEINALLSGMDVSGGEADGGTPDSQSAEEAPVAKVTADNSGGNAGTVMGAGSTEIDESLLTSTERDAIGEVANISMGSSATTLYSLVNQKVSITTPTVSLARWDTLIESYERPCVFIQIHYTDGLAGSNILILGEQDVKIITDLMMGGDGTNVDGELGELHLSAISEAMNQMMGASATSLSSMLGRMIDISPPEANLIDLTEFKSAKEIAPFLEGTFCKIEFKMQIDSLVDSKILQLYPIDFAKSLYDTFISSQLGEEKPAAKTPAPTPTPAAPEAVPFTPPPVAAMPDMSGAYAQQGMQVQGMQVQGMPMQGMQMQGMPMQGMQMQGMQVPGMQMQGIPVQGMPNIQPAQFQSFSANAGQLTSPPENIALIMDVPLEVTVELGRTKKSISDILDFAPGTTIELDKIAGEPIDVLVNGKLVAKGEVVVIEESFGVRVTEIIK